MKYVLLVIFITVFGCSSDDMNSRRTDAGQTSDTSFDGSTDDADVSNVDLGQQDAAADTDITESELPPGPRLVDGDSRVFEPGDVVDCDCPNPADVCTPRGECVLGTHGCFDNADCPDGYQCGDQICYANTDETIVPLCQVNENCPSYTVCVGGACQTPRSCIASMYCPPGLICGEGPAPVSPYCIGPGDKAGGDACTTGYECQSGNCLSGQCRQQCLRNGDCPGQSVCEDNGLCTTADLPIDRAYCGDGIIAISAGQDCSDRLCRKNGDCLSGTCSLRYCVSADKSIGCKSNEFQEPLSPQACFIYQRCYQDSECPTNYTCIKGGCGREI